ncbi:MAG: trypsin-like peptidase domain-containing protein [Pseudomonadota bacterium]
MLRHVRFLITSLIGAGLASNVAAETPNGWNKTLQNIASGVVSIRVDSTRAFDTDWNSSTQATGFVVDAEHGLIVTNRHVVTPGPVTAEAVFRNNEEVALTPVYRDPVHDFGLFRYDPSKLRYIEPTELSLDPRGARIGREIRVVGNDAGEQLSILAGTIARLDRRAPAYGRGKYNDFNTYYLQAASGTSGGSSGSPVIGIDGKVVALNAGGSTQAASSFFLPLDRVARAVDLVRQGESVSRGTLQTVFVAEPYDELRRLGLTEDAEAKIRAEFPDNTGSLVVTQVIPDSPADAMLEPGDILLRVNDRWLAGFVELADVLDSNVGQRVVLDVQRGGVAHRFDVPVTDLHGISPASYVHFGDAIVHSLSYQQARHYNRPLTGVYVANPGYIFSTVAVPRGAIITEFAGKSVATLEDFEAVLATLADGTRAPIRYVTLDSPQTENLRILRIERRWFPSQHCLRNDALGAWPCRTLAGGPPPETPTPASTEFSPSDDPVEQALAASMVLVNFDMPYSVSGVGDRHFYGTGLIVDVERGLVVVDRNTVPVAMGDVTLTFAGSLEIPGRVEYVHPLHNLTMVSYDPALIGATPVRAAQLSQRTAKAGDDVWVVGLGGNHRLSSQKTVIASLDALALPTTRTMRFRDTNLEAISVVNAPGNVDGVLADARGRVAALWSSFAAQSGNNVTQIYRGIPVDVVRDFVELVQNSQDLYSLEAELGYTPLATARKLGLSDDWSKKLERHDPRRRQVLAVTRLVGGSPAAERLRIGDLILAIDGEVVNTFRELERATQRPSVTLSLWRNEQFEEIEVATVALPGGGIDRIVVWAGALLQDTHREVAAQRGIEPHGVYVAFFNYGSPATRYGLWGGRRIIEIDGVPTPNLDAFVDAVAGKRDRESLRVKTLNFNDAVEVTTLKLDERYWPAYELTRDDDGWTRRSLGGT